ncbi:MAG: hypothetical protein HN423_00690, partial [Alphaproteobacteria bacterium]|nr:hypothetical protein [Alphaproteobacteria bacterium]
MTRARFAGALAVGALILAACAPARIVAVEGVRAPVAAPAVGVQPPAPQANLQPPAAPEVPPPPLPTMELAEFIGLSPFEVAEVLGDPDLDRKEPTAQ